MLATPVVDAVRHSRTYEKVQDRLSGLKLPIDLPDVRVISPNDQLAVLVSGMSRLSGWKRGIRLGESYVGAFHFGGLYIYEPLVTAAHP